MGTYHQQLWIVLCIDSFCERWLDHRPGLHPPLFKNQISFKLVPVV